MSNDFLFFALTTPLVQRLQIQGLLWSRMVNINADQAALNLPKTDLGDHPMQLKATLFKF